MRLLIAGWQGQIARTFVEVTPGRPDVTACAVGRPALDICEMKSIERALGDIDPDIVINTAGYTAVDNAESEPERAFALNRDGARLLAAAAARRGVPIIHISTDYVFDGQKSGPYVETDPAAPATVYGRSKLEGEAAVQAANPRHIILRTSWVFSPFGRNFVKTSLQRARDGEPLRVVSDQRGSPTYAPHFVATVLAVAGRATRSGEPEPDWGIYHAAGDGAATWYDLGCEVLASSRRLGGPDTSIEAISSAEFPTRAPRLANAELDCTKLERNFGLHLPAWRDGIADCVKRLLAEG